MLLRSLLLLLSYHLGLVQSQTYTPVTADQNEQRTFLQQNEAKWNSLVVTNYLYTMDKGCHACCWSNTCSAANYPWQLQINTDTNAGTDYTGTKAIDSKNGAVSNGKSMGLIFDEIEQVLNTQNQFVEATYDQTWGYPTRYKIQDGVDPNSASTTLTEVSIYNFAETFTSQRSDYISAITTWSRVWPPGSLKDYEFTYFDTSPNAIGYQYPVRVQVYSGSVLAAYDNRNTYLGTNFRTLDDYFSAIDLQIAYNAPFISNTYDVSFGYPTYIFMIPNPSSGVSTNTEISISTFSFL